jgi:hypothetical protein
MAALQTLLAERGLTAAQVELINTEAVEWFDGCLGIVRPDALCAPGAVPGYNLLFAVGDEIVEVHTNLDGSAVAIVQPAAATLRVAVLLLDGSVQIVETSLASDPANPPAETGFQPRGGASRGVVYALPFVGPPQAVSADPAAAPAAQPLDFLGLTNYALAVWPGDASSGPALAWGTQIDYDTNQTALLTAAPDGSQRQTLLAEDGTLGAPHQFVAHRWASAGRALFFSREPVGIGGYILFAGASSLYRLSLPDRQVTELIPFDIEQGVFICYDALSPDERYVAGHCARTAITVQDLQTGESLVLATPAEVAEFGSVGSARFSPDGARVAYALAMHNPDAEQGWVAVSDRAGGPAALVAASAPGQSYNVEAWLNADNLLVQVNDVLCSPECVNEVLLVNVANGAIEKIAEGVYLALLP